MVKIILPYFDKLQANDEQSKKSVEFKNAGIAEWKEYQTNAQGEIQIPAEYQAIIEDLVKVFESETIPTGTKDFRTMSPNIETAMEVLYNRLLPDFKEDDISKRQVIGKQNHLDIELLLYAAYKAFDTHFDSLKTRGREAYCIRVIGILQNFLPPETAKIFCAGLYYVLGENREVDERAAGLYLQDGTTLFYSGSDFAHQKGLGFEFLICGEWRGSGWPQRRADRRSDVTQGQLMSIKNNTFQRITQHDQQQASSLTGPRT